MLKGTIKFFNEVQGFGFIEPSEKGKDVFFHFSGMKNKAQVTKNDKGKPVEYELKEGKKGPEADNISIVTATKTPASEAAAGSKKK